MKDQVQFGQAGQILSHVVKRDRDQRKRYRTLSATFLAS